MTIERVRAHYGFSRMPFSRSLAPGMLFARQAHREATARIAWLVAEAAIGVVTGEVGAGKTVAARAATAALDPSRHTVVYLPNPAVGARGLYAFVVSALGGVPSFHRPALVAQTAELLAAEEAERAKRVVVVVDESHLLSADQLEQLRILTNFEMDSASPLALLLLGQPTLRRRIKLGAFAALDQRIALRYHLEGMDLAETVAYVKHHLALAGRSDPLFSDDALAAVHRTSRGVPRAVNNLALQALVAAFAEGKGIIDESCARAAIDEVMSE
jgi:type II secretory pathway predicted ATPase ExeA